MELVEDQGQNPLVRLRWCLPLRGALQCSGWLHKSSLDEQKIKYLGPVQPSLTGICSQTLTVSYRYVGGTKQRLRQVLIFSQPQEKLPSAVLPDGDPIRNRHNFIGRASNQSHTRGICH